MNGAMDCGLGEALLAALDQAPVILGPVAFEGHEVPSRISIGGAQTIKIHRFPGGGRVIDAMGFDDSAIFWKGFFTGHFAAARARLVDVMRQNGQLVGLSFGDYVFNVVVVHFEYDLQDRGALISYRIRMEIVPSNIVQIGNTAALIATFLSDDVVMAAATLSGFEPSEAQIALTGAVTALALPGGPTSTIMLTVTRFALQAAGNAISADIFSSGSRLSGYSETESPNETTALGLTAAVTAAGSLAAATQAGGYVNRSNSWLNQLAGQPLGMPSIFA